MVADLIEGDGQRVAHDIVSEGGEALAVPCDISDEASVQALVREAIAAFGGIDILVNIVAYRPKADFFDMPIEEWDRAHAVNTRGTFLCMREAIKVMRGQGKERGGAIVNISTIGTHLPTIVNNVHYDSSKAGVNSIT